MGARAARAWASLRTEWAEAPWFVVLVIGVTAFAGPIVLWELWQAISQALPGDG